MLQLRISVLMQRLSAVDLSFCLFSVPERNAGFNFLPIFLFLLFPILYGKREKAGGGTGISNPPYFFQFIQSKNPLPIVLVSFTSFCRRHFCDLWWSSVAALKLAKRLKLNSLCHRFVGSFLHPNSPLDSLQWPGNHPHPSVLSVHLHCVTDYKQAAAGGKARSFLRQGN